MSFNINGHNVFVIVFVTFIASLIFVYLAKLVAKYCNIVDIPNQRSVHMKPIPLMGGVGIFLAFLVGYMFFAPQNVLMLSILISSFLILLLGILDDIKPIPARYKFLVHIVVASIIVFYGGLKMDYIEIFNFSWELSWYSSIITIIMIVGIINAINLCDGLDGLCSGISSIYFFTIGTIALLLNKNGGLDVILSFIMLGSTLGFLVYNLPPAKIFMGDAGSTFLGLMISVIMLLGFKTYTVTSLVIPAILLILPITDTLFAIIRRTIKGKSISEPDKEHIHHQLLKRVSTKQTLFIIYLIDIIFSVITIFYALGYRKEMIAFYIFLVFIILFLVFKTEVIFKKDKK